ncbi:class I SAM-dependent methyltransferase [Desulfuromonas sp. TF]|uniref:class I SAM-dependent methyltransferase n=1 Tax=Desulfuromonas sp. TF TaxID=1232410 RepID=UPI000488B310|nr:class I SAM-dependent methyltransferase [Desulfuromonas sp. TF]
MAAEHLCPSCGEKKMKVFHQASQVPSNSCILLGSREEAISYPKGDINLGFCLECGFAANTSFDPGLTEYSGRYEETQGFSATFNAFHRTLARQLIDRHQLCNKHILEIGCGKGEFLLLLCELGNNRGTGFDPGYHEGRLTGPAASRVTFIKDFYSEKYADIQADLVVCKMTLEHIGPTGEFVRMIRRAIGDRLETTVYFQVPDTTRILHQCAFEDIYYEHCSYFSSGSLARLFRASGFNIISLDTQYDGQYLTVEVRPARENSERPISPRERDLAQIKKHVSTFPIRFEEKVRRWRQKLDWNKLNGRKVVLWGSGSKGVAFLTTLGITDEVQYVVDVNPYRHGYFMPGSGQEIVAPEFLREYRPDLVVVMNAIYCDEIRGQLQSMGLEPDMMAV